MLASRESKQDGKDPLSTNCKTLFKTEATHTFCIFFPKSIRLDISCKLSVALQTTLMTGQILSEKNKNNKN